MYGGLGATFFLLVLFLQEVAGYSALQAGLALMPSTIVMFVLSKRPGGSRTASGPRLFMGLGPLIAAVGLALMLRLRAHVNYFTELLPALLVFSIGLACTVAPLTATVLSDADESNAGIASGVNNAIARVAGLLAIAAVGAVISASSARAGPAAWPASGSRRRRGRRRAGPRQTLARVDPSHAGGRSHSPYNPRRFTPSTSGSASPHHWSRSAGCWASPGSATRDGRAQRGLRRRPVRRPAAGRRARQSPAAVPAPAGASATAAGRPADASAAPAGNAARASGLTVG